jgi:hypothetical protein
MIHSAVGEEQSASGIVELWIESEDQSAKKSFRKAGHLFEGTIFERKNRFAGHLRKQRVFMAAVSIFAKSFGNADASKIGDVRVSTR